MASEWYCQIDGSTSGPFSVEELLSMAESGQLTARDQIRRGTSGTWLAARDLPGMRFSGEQIQEVLEARPARREAPRRREAEDPIEGLDADLTHDILKRTFDSPAIRAERLVVLTGGAEPLERFRTCKVVWQRKPAAWISSEVATEFMGDLIFTDCGILATNFAKLPKKGESGNQALIHFGLIGFIAYSVAESSRMKREKSRAEEIYYDEADAWGDARPAGLFRRIVNAEFVPADEIVDARFTKAGILEFRFRGNKYRVTPDSGARHEEFLLPEKEDFETWLEGASTTRSNRKEVLETAGPAALAEWAARSRGPVPAWVVASIDRIDEAWVSKPRPLLKWIPKTFHAPLYRRLHHVQTPAAESLARSLGWRLRLPNVIAIVIGVIMLLVGGGLGVLAFQIVANGDDPTGPVVLACILSLIGAIITVAGMVGLASLRRKPEA